MLSSGVADFDGGDYVIAFRTFFWRVAFLELENIDVSGDFSLPV